MENLELYKKLFQRSCESAASNRDEGQYLIDNIKTPKDTHISKINDKLILGISRQHDVSAALFQNDRLLGIAEAERVMEIKHARGAQCVVPAILTLCWQHGISIEDIDVVVLAENAVEKINEQFIDSSASMHSSSTPFFKIGGVKEFQMLTNGGIPLHFKDNLEVYCTCHTATHAMSALYFAGFSECAVLVSDGYGVCCGTMAYHYKDGKLIRLEDFKDIALLGWRYQLFGHLIKEIDSEKTDILDLAGKVMGLNAYGAVVQTYVDYFRQWFYKPYDDYETCWRLDKTFFDDLIDGGFRKNCCSIEDKDFLNIIASMQEAYISVLVEVAQKLINKTNVKKMIVSGGCALNVLANERLSRLTDEVFFQPNSGDSGLSLGAASCLAAITTGEPLHHPRIPLKYRRNPFMGLRIFDNDLILNYYEKYNTILNNSICYKLLNDESMRAETIGRMLTMGKIIGIVDGRMEVGPRALGHRSIIANASFSDMRNTLNYNIKYREWWRPFAPVCREIDAKDYFSFEHGSPYMLLTAKVKPELLARLSSACHDDGTARLQVLFERDDGPLLWDVLKWMKAENTIPVLVNTSFNLGGKPMLNTAKSAFDMFVSTKMDALYINEYFFYKT